ncbi:glutamate receptor ionotropic, kainate glr-3-like [Macrobrachium nipponense]|uniref:glutamate receptor ionotropic, kainate glr-3-like n=1 Tax=Macrobrachium nipponense TaxID=159736 RepID=UPI0030C7AEF1
MTKVGLRLWVRPETKILLVGRKEEVQPTLWTPVFRNTVHPLYVGLSDLTFRALQNFSGQLQCLRINANNLCADQDFLNNEDEAKSLHGLLLSIVTLPYFPYVDFQLNRRDLSRPALLEDCLGKRIIDAVSPVLNFTYKITAPPDLQFGTPTVNGTWTGIIGIFQKEGGDMTLMMATSDGKNPIIDHARIVPSDAVVIVSLKPRPPPQYFVIIRPFTVNVWIYVLASIMIWAVSFWVLQKLRSKVMEKKSISLEGAIFYSIAVVLDHPPEDAPRHSTGQMSLAWWLIPCLVLSTVFRSSLVAQLSVQSKTKPINSYDDLIKQSHWSLGNPRRNAGWTAEALLHQ